MKFNLKTRDFINIGVFTVIYIIVFYGAGMLGTAAPWMMFVGWTIGILLDGIVVILLLARTPKMGTLTILGVFVALIMLPGGHSPFVLLGCPVLGFVADMVQSEMGRANRLDPKRGIAAYTIFTLWFMVPLLPYLYASEAAFAQVEQGLGKGYADQMRALFQPWILGIWAICIVILALLGGFLGTRIGKKHFQRAGLTR